MTSKIHGHRGARGLRPENTLSAIDYALECGADGIEVDLCVSKDDIVIVHHDLQISAKTAKDANGQWLTASSDIRQLDWHQLRELDVGQLNPGYEYASGYPQQQPVIPSSIPTLNDFIQHVLASPFQPIFNLELKGHPDHPKLLPPVEHYVSLVLQQINQFDILERVFLQSFDWRLMLELKEKVPSLKTGLLTDQQDDGEPRSPQARLPTDWSAQLDLADFNGSVPDMVKHAGADVWSCNHLDLTTTSLQRAHEIGLEVYVWTVNEEADMQRLSDWGVDVITTDYPDRCRQVLYP